MIGRYVEQAHAGYAGTGAQSELPKGGAMRATHGHMGRMWTGEAFLAEGEWAWEKWQWQEVAVCVWGMANSFDGLQHNVKWAQGGKVRWGTSWKGLCWTLHSQVITQKNYFCSLVSPHFGSKLSILKPVRVLKKKIKHFHVKPTQSIQMC